MFQQNVKQYYKTIQNKEAQSHLTKLCDQKIWYLDLNFLKDCFVIMTICQCLMGCSQHIQIILH